MAENSLGVRIKHAWNAFMNKDPTSTNSYTEVGSYRRPDRVRLGRAIDRTVVNAIYNRISLDVSTLDFRHVILNKESGRFESYANSMLDNCLSLEANIDQTSRAFIQDVVLSMMSEGCCAIAPIDTDDAPSKHMPGGVDIETMRTARIVQWFPRDVEVEAYNDRKGKREKLKYKKENIAIVENPFYSVMNEPSSTMQRLIRKLSLLDAVDEESSSGRLDLIIQLPYVIKSKSRKEQAEERRHEIEQQLSGSKYGVAYTDGTEKVIQLNRSLENNLLKQIEYLTTLLFSQLGITQAILDGTADESTMTNYYSRVIEPYASAIADEMKRKFLSKTARSQMHSIEFYRDPFKLVPVGQIADIADKFTRNEIMTSNELRQIIGMKPINDPKADQLINSNLNHTPEELGQIPTTENEDDETTE